MLSVYLMLSHPVFFYSPQLSLFHCQVVLGRRLPWVVPGPLLAWVPPAPLALEQRQPSSSNSRPLLCLCRVSK